MGSNLQGKVAVVTGSGQGIGRAIALGMAGEGARVVTNNRRPGSTGYAIMNDSLINSLSDEKREWLEKLAGDATGDAETTAKAIVAAGGEAVPFFGDVSDFEVARKLIQTAVDSFGKIDILVNVAGSFGFGAIYEMSEEIWDRVTSIKPKGHFNCIRHAAPLMMEQKWGRILNCTSRAFTGDIIKHANYCAANAGVVGLTYATAKELYEYGITCNAFSPYARTRASFELMAYDMAVEGSKKPFLAERAPLPLEATPQPEELVPFLVYLCMETAAGISGTVFSVGGASIGMYSEPEVKRSMFKQGGPWTVEEIAKLAPRGLFQGYRNPAAELP
jgi:3-oxoacyl-[acyl-carrier protein] reductase